MAVWSIKLSYNDIKSYKRISVGCLKMIFYKSLIVSDVAI